MSRGGDRPARFGGFVGTTVVGGLLFLLPLGLAILVLEKLVSAVAPIARTIHDRLFPQAQSNAGALLLSLLLLLAVAFVAGVLARSGSGRAIFARMESGLLMRMPAYSLLRETVHGFAGRAAEIAEAESDVVVLVRLDDQTLVGIVKERLGDGRSVVFLPGAPSGFSGTVAVLDDARLEATEMRASDLLNRMRRLGAGLVVGRPPA